MADKPELHEERLIPESMDDRRGRTPEELPETLEVLDAHLKSLHQSDEGELRDLSDEEESAFNLGMQMLDRDHDRPSSTRRCRGAPPPPPGGRAAGVREHPVRPRRPGRGHAAADEPGGPGPGAARPRRPRRQRLSDAAKTQVEKHIRRDTITARRILVTENEDYRTAWMKMVTDPHPVLSAEENRAVQAWYEFRAMGDWTTTAGGFGIPVFIDPSIILTAQESSNPFLSIAKQVTVNTNQWKGVCPPV